MLLLLLILMLPGVVYGQTYVAEEEFVGPFTTWKNVKTDYGATGDGSTNDAPAIQNGLNALGVTAGVQVLYFPAGTYRITSTLTLNARTNVVVVGASPGTVTLRWAGSNGGTMFSLNGTAVSKISRITFNGLIGAGPNRAGKAILQAWDGTTGVSDFGNQYSDLVLQDVGVGYTCGGAQQCSETALYRNYHLRNGVGVQTINGNSLDVWVWQSKFEDCDYGVTNNGATGQFHVYESYFLRSTAWDIYTVNAGNFSARYNTSKDSRIFYGGLNLGNPVQISLIGNTIIDPTQSTAIVLESQGPIFLLDNIIRSRSGAIAPIVDHDTLSDASTEGDLIVVNNLFTVTSPIASEGRLVNLGTTVVTLSDPLVTGLGAPTLPDTPADQSRHITEVASGASTATIQSAITNDCTSFGGNKPVIHFAPATFSITSTLEVPQGCDVQLVGDGFNYITTGTRLLAAGADPVLRMNGYSKASLRDLTIDGNSQSSVALKLQAVDQTGGRVYGEQVQLGHGKTQNLLVDRLDSTRVEFRDLNNYNYVNDGIGLRVVGGVLADAGTPVATGKTLVWSGSGSDVEPTFTVSNGGTLIVYDYWSEITTAHVNLVNTKGTFILNSSFLGGQVNQATKGVTINGHQGSVLFTTVQMLDRIGLSGSGSNLTSLVLGLQGGVYDSNTVSSSYADTTSPAASARRWSSRQNYDFTSGGATQQVSDIGAVDLTFLNTALTPMRNERRGILASTGVNVSDIRLYRIALLNSTTNLWITGSTVIPTPVPTRTIR